MKALKTVLFAGSFFGLTAQTPSGAPVLWVILPCMVVLGLFVWANCRPAVY